jgi:hypothetical protein
MHNWRVTIECWPFSGVEQKEAGLRVHDFSVAADNMMDAVLMAMIYQAGMLRSPQVWRAPITSIRRMEHDEHIPYQEKLG